MGGTIRHIGTGVSAGFGTTKDTKSEKLDFDKLPNQAISCANEVQLGIVRFLTGGSLSHYNQKKWLDLAIKPLCYFKTRLVRFQSLHRQQTSCIRKKQQRRNLHHNLHRSHRNLHRNRCHIRNQRTSHEFGQPDHADDHGFGR